MKVWGLPVRVLRTGLLVLVVLDLIVLAALSVHVTTTQTRTVVPLSAVEPAARPTSVPPSTSAAPPAVLAAPIAPPAAATVAPDGPAPRVVPAAPHRPALPTPSTSAAPAPPSPAPASPVSAQQPCPIPLKAPAQTGGLQSLIDFAPAFGPFSAEAFAAASAYQPMLQLLGPILAQYPALAPKLSPVIDPLIQLSGQGLTVVYGLIEPLYAPYRQQVLQAETRLAAALAPYAQQLANSPLGGCIVGLEAALVSAGAR